MTMLEKAARALCERTEGRDDVWDDMSGSDQNDYMESARTVLMAIREPDAVAVDAAKSEASYVDREDLSDAFSAMIDAILFEGR